MARSTSGHGFELWSPGATGEHPCKWYPLATSLGGHGWPWRSPQDHRAATHHGNLPEGHLIISEKGEKKKIMR